MELNPPLQEKIKTPYTRKTRCLARQRGPVRKLCGRTFGVQSLRVFGGSCAAVSLGWPGPEVLLSRLREREVDYTSGGVSNERRRACKAR